MTEPRTWTIWVCDTCEYTFVGLLGWIEAWCPTCMREGRGRDNPCSRVEVEALRLAETLQEIANFTVPEKDSDCRLDLEDAIDRCRAVLSAVHGERGEES